MHSRFLTTLAVIAGLSVVPAVAQAAPREITIDTAGPAQTWPGTSAQGLNVSWFTDDQTNRGACGTTPTDYCDDTLVHFTSARPLDDSMLTFRIDGYDHSDYDLRVYTSDAEGTVGDYLGAPTGDNAGLIPLETFAGDPESLTTYAEPGDYYLVRVVYFTAAGDENYTGTVSWDGALTPE